MKAKRPVITSPFQELTVLEGFEPGAQKPKWTCWYYVTPEEEVWFGESTKGKRDISVEEFNEGLEYVKDDELYPEIPKEMELKLAPEHLNEENSYVKRPGLAIYKDMKGSGYIPKNLLDETLMMEKISKLNHPNMVSYHGVHTKRGRITSMYLEKLDKTLEQCVGTPDFEKLDKARFMEALRSAIDAVHGLGLAHNDLNPENIMVREGLPVLIDFGSCAPFGQRIESLGTHGWVEEQTWISEQKKDEFALEKLPGWLEDPTGDNKVGNARPTITSPRDLTITEAMDPRTDRVKYTTFYHVTPEEKIWFGQLFKEKGKVTIPEFNDALTLVNDEELYPKLPAGVTLMLAPDHLNGEHAWVKRPGLASYEDMVGTDYIPTGVLNEALAMEKVSKLQHPHIVQYLGCRVRRGRITSIFIERLDQTLAQYASTPEFAQLEEEAFMTALQSAVDAIHGIGLAHNDVNPHNIMVKDGLPVLIDFGSCLPVGTVLQTGGTSGWIEEPTEFSDREHDHFALRRMPGWLKERKEANKIRG